MPESPQTPWQEILKFCGGVRTVIWAAGIMIAAILYLFSLPLLVVGLVGGGSFVLLALGMYGLVSASNKRPIESLGEQIRLAPPVPFEAMRPQVDISQFSHLPNATAGKASTAETRTPTVTPPGPVFECENDTRVLIYGIDWSTKQIVREAPTLEELRQPRTDITFVWAVLARFYFRSDSRVDPTLYLSAHVAFRDLDDQLLKRVIDAVWDGEQLKRSKHIQQGRALELIVALVPIDPTDSAGMAEMLYTVEYGEKTVRDLVGNTVEVAPELVLISGKEFLLNIELLPKKTSKEPFPLQPFRFRLLLKPDIKLTRTRTLG